MDFVEVAEKIAKEAYHNQVDNQGYPYFIHTKAVATLCSKPNEKAVAYLHDVLEYTSLTIADLKAAAIPQKVIDAVVVLTRKEEETLFEYLDRIKKNNLAMIITLASIDLRIEAAHTKDFTTQDFVRVERYQQARRYLLDEL
ncbi:GTP pyrophosphokinase [Enterococcus sp. HY326]|uniref:GTP pyrophosphokinase n=1 Tax=Enterococcus sp. HY326 TaxID=2971265 RepID=UPI00223F6207|nr:GTP pyrophosphokinase [Enterococcus sp. HY326]